MRLIDADKLILFPNNPESGTKVMIDNWIDECGLSNLELYITEDCPVDIEHALTELCWKVIQGYINVIETEPTAFDVDKVVEQLEVLKNLNHKEWKKSSWTGEEIMPYLFAHNSYVKAIKIVKAGGV
jgi:hypothetical protein